MNIPLALIIIGITIGTVFLALYLSTVNQCVSFEEHVYTNGYNKPERPYDVCMHQNGMPAIHLTMPSYDIKHPAWNTTRVWIE